MMQFERHLVDLAQASHCRWRSKLFIAHLQKLSFTSGGNPRGRFALGLVQSEWKVYVKRHLDREEQDIYFLNITATDGLFVTQAMVEVTVSDVNDNSPVCDQVRSVAMSDCCFSLCFSKIKSKPISFFSLKPGYILFLSP